MIRHIDVIVNLSDIYFPALLSMVAIDYATWFVLSPKAAMGFFTGNQVLELKQEAPFTQWKMNRISHISGLNGNLNVAVE